VTQGKDKAMANSTDARDIARVALIRDFEFRLPLSWLLAAPLQMDKVRGPKSSDVLTVRLRLRFSVWQNHLPVDALPVEGWIELELLTEEDLAAMGG
jgi:hypothetical protein